MTRTNTNRNLIAASTLGAVTAFIMFAQAGQASAASSVLSCEGSNRRAAMECCQQQVEKRGLPLWMRYAGANCSTPRIVKCAPSTHSASVNKPCKISMIQFEGGNGNRENGRGNKR